MTTKSYYLLLLLSLFISSVSSFGQDNKESNKLHFEQDGLIVMEIESEELKGTWEKGAEFKGFTGEGYYYYSEGDNRDTLNTELILNYSFYIDNPGIYKVVLRNYIPSQDNTLANDVFMKMDDGKWWKVFGHNNFRWNWETIMDHDNHIFSDNEWYLDTGKHVLQICARSAEFGLDRIHIFNTQMHKDFCYDPDISESVLEPDTEGLMHLDKQFIQLNYKESDEITIDDISIQITNKGNEPLQKIAASSDTKWVVPEITGTKNNQKLMLTFTDDVTNLKTGKYMAEVTLTCANATSKLVKVLIVVDPVGKNLAKGKKVYASLVDSAGHAPGYAIDNNLNTYWFTARANLASLHVDLGTSVKLKKVVLKWGAQYGKVYHILTSQDGKSWKKVYTELNGNGDGDTDEIYISDVARYVKFDGEYSYEDNGYWLYEMQIFGEPQD